MFFTNCFLSLQIKRTKKQAETKGNVTSSTLNKSKKKIAEEMKVKSIGTEEKDAAGGKPDETVLATKKNETLEKKEAEPTLLHRCPEEEFKFRD